jgi:hypothetical protein
VTQGGAVSLVGLLIYIYIGHTTVIKSKVLKKRRKLTKACKLAADLLEATLDLHGDLCRTPSERRAYTKYAAVLYFLIRNKKRFQRSLTQFADEAENEGYTPYELGYYLRKRLKDKPLL